MAVGGANLKELILGHWVHSWEDQCFEVIDGGVSPHEWDIPECAHVPVLGAGSVPAVVSKDEVAATEVEGEHPAVNDKAEGLKEEPLDVAPDHEWEHEDVENPDKESSAWSADETNCKEEHPVEDPVEGGN